MEKQFNVAAKRISDPKYAGKGPSANAEKLEVYALFKQATVGDVTGSQPWAVKIEARQKWDAWSAVKGSSKEDAMTKYVAVVNKFLGEPSEEELA